MPIQCRKHGRSRETAIQPTLKSENKEIPSVMLISSSDLVYGALHLDVCRLFWGIDVVISATPLWTGNNGGEDISTLKQGGDTRHFLISQKKRRIEPMLDQCWAGVVDGGPALVQHWVGVSRLLGCSPQITDDHFTH